MVSRSAESAVVGKEERPKPAKCSSSHCFEIGLTREPVSIDTAFNRPDFREWNVDKGRKLKIETRSEEIIEALPTWKMRLGREPV